MTDPFTDVADELMTRSTDLGSAEAPAPPMPSGGKTKKSVCPYCGAVTAVFEKPTGPCPRCNMEDTPATRAATKARIGPWYVLQTRNPSAPGMKWATMLSLVSKGQVTPRSVVRGPTTHQLWKFAAHVKGLSREFNLCYSCGGEIERAANQCPHCDRLQEPPVNPDALLESREMAPRGAVQRELKGPAMLAGPAPSMGQSMQTDLILSGSPGDELARKRSPDDGILSAKELAAAFQLDFNPQSPATLPPPERARRRPMRTFALLILLAGIGGGALLFARPDYRDKSLAWANTTLASLKGSIANSTRRISSANSDISSKKPRETDATALPAPEEKDSGKSEPIHVSDHQSPAPEEPAKRVATVDEAAPPAVAPPTMPPAPPVLPPAPALVPPAVTGTSAEIPAVPTPTPSPVRPDAVAIQPPPEPVAEPTREPAKEPAAPSNSVAPANSNSGSPPNVVAAPPARTTQPPGPEKSNADLDSPVPTDLESQRALGHRLWVSALDAQRQQDYPQAVKCYEKLKQLDSSVRQTDKRIDLELSIVRSQLPSR